MQYSNYIIHFIKEYFAIIFYLFIISNIVIRVIITKKSKKKKKKSRKGGGNIYEIFRDFLKIIWCIITFGYGKGCFQDKVEIPTVKQLWYETEAGDDFGGYLFDNEI